VPRAIARVGIPQLLITRTAAPGIVPEGARRREVAASDTTITTRNIARNINFRFRPPPFLHIRDDISTCSIGAGILGQIRGRTLRGPRVARSGPAEGGRLFQQAFQRSREQTYREIPATAGGPVRRYDETAPGSGRPLRPGDKLPAGPNAGRTPPRVPDLHHGPRVIASSARPAHPDNPPPSCRRQPDPGRQVRWRRWPGCASAGIGDLAIARMRPLARSCRPRCALHMNTLDPEQALADQQFALETRRGRADAARRHSASADRPRPSWDSMFYAVLRGLAWGPAGVAGAGGARRLRMRISAAPSGSPTGRQLWQTRMIVGGVRNRQADRRSAPPSGPAGAGIRCGRRWSSAMRWSARQAMSGPRRQGLPPRAFPARRIMVLLPGNTTGSRAAGACAEGDR
jgi:hypothetical protein